MATRASIKSTLKKWQKKERHIRRQMARCAQQMKKFDRAVNTAGNMVDELKRQLQH